MADTENTRAPAGGSEPTNISAAASVALQVLRHRCPQTEAVRDAIATLSYALRECRGTPAAGEPTPTLLARMREMRDVQGQHGNWNCNEYMQGLYNGMEYQLALAEGRDPVFRSKPEEGWLDERFPLAASSHQAAPSGSGEVDGSDTRGAG